jgi:hypothetical protein
LIVLLRRDHHTQIPCHLQSAFRRQHENFKRHTDCSVRSAMPSTRSECRVETTTHIRCASIHTHALPENSSESSLGWNYSPTSKDNDAISQAYQDVDVELHSPAFLWPDTIPTETFSNGTSGPTNETVLGKPAAILSVIGRS